jgi:cytochrome P450
MSSTTSNSVYYDPYDTAIYADPYPVFRRLREEAPLYYNEDHDFYAVSRYADVEKGWSTVRPTSRGGGMSSR